MEELLALLEGPLNQKEVELSDLPDLDLYMDQIITLFADKAAGPESLLTKTMINNYSKEGLLKPIKGKKYSREHILQMLFIYRLKQTLSIQQIKGVTQKLSEEAEKEELPSRALWESLYGNYLSSRKQNSSRLSTMLEELLQENTAESSEDLAQLLLQLSWISYMTKIMCDLIVERDFPILEKKKEK